METVATPTSVKVTFDSRVNTMQITFENKAIVFTPIWLGSVVSRETLDFFGRCEHTAQWQPYGIDTVEINAIITEKIFNDCLKLADNQIIDLN